MLQCDETITFVRRTVVSGVDTYPCTTVEGASWYAKMKLVTQDGGAYFVPVVKVRIPAENLPTGFTPQKGDYVCRGTVTSVTKPADLEGVEHFTAMMVGDNTRGHNPHWAVSGSE